MVSRDKFEPIAGKYEYCHEIHTKMMNVAHKEVLKTFKFTRQYPFHDFEIQIDNLPQGNLNQYAYDTLKELLHGLNKYYERLVETDDFENMWEHRKDLYLSTIKAWEDKDVQKAEMEDTVEREVQRRMKDLGL